MDETLVETTEPWVPKATISVKVPPMSIPRLNCSARSIIRLSVAVGSLFQDFWSGYVCR